MASLPPSPPTHDQLPGDGDESGKWWQTMTKQDAERYALVAASIFIIALTAGAFWLSYAHLADIAGQHGLGTSPIRRWAWPATLDAFLVAGELLMLRAGLRRVTDKWAIAVTAIGSVGSIALNVAGVTGTGKASAVPFLDYVVAAVPPAAAMVAFGVLMRQIHQLVERPVDHSEPGSTPVPEPRVTHSVQLGKSLVTAVGQSAEAPVERVLPAELLVEPGQATELPVAVSVQSPESPDETAEGKPRGGRPPGAPLEELVEIGRIALAEHRTLTRSGLRNAVKAKGLTISSERQTDVMAILRPEIEAAAETSPDSG
ncbi:DUF2637 domain-containing protein [Streptomyces sp. ISL-22]|uniref:DUF2637 domain-containing protein n=2 Tax=unclassified Streptomyces TaxID=2593676 RepID=UPI0020350C30|nr:DUF2637 domain-containing protein [Streptomyces sp. ISL-22]